VSPEDPAPEPTDDLIFGKYKSMEEAKRGYFELQNYASQTKTQLENLKRPATQASPVNPGVGDGVAATVPGGSPGAQDRVNPVSRNFDWSQNEAVAKASEQLGVDTSALAPLMDMMVGEAERITQERLDSTLGPMQAQAQAQARMARENPDFVRLESDVSMWLEVNPQIAQSVINMHNQGLYNEAYDYAWSKFQGAQLATTEQEMKANQQVAEEERKTARAAAGLPSTPGTPVHAAAKSDDVSGEELLKLEEQYRKGDAEAGRKVRMIRMKSMMSEKDWEKFLDQTAY
jgi:hypothetical protein